MSELIRVSAYRRCKWSISDARSLSLRGGSFVGCVAKRAAVRYVSFLVHGLPRDGGDGTVCHVTRPVVSDWLANSGPVGGRAKLTWRRFMIGLMYALVSRHGRQTCQQFE